MAVETVLPPTTPDAAGDPPCNWLRAGNWVNDASKRATCACALLQRSVDTTVFLFPPLSFVSSFFDPEFLFLALNLPVQD